MEISKPIINAEVQKPYYANKIKEMKIYFDNNLGIYEYYRSQLTYMDQIYLLRGKMK